MLIDKSKKYHAFNANPFVGYISSGENIEIVPQREKIICRQSRGATLLMAFVAFMILTCLGYMMKSPDMVRYVRDFHHAEWMGKLGLGFLGLFILFLFGTALIFSLRKLFANTRIVVESEGHLSFYQGWKEKPYKIVYRHEMEMLSLETVTFQGKRQTHINTILILKLKTGDEMVLCASLNRETLETFQQEISRRAGL